MVTMTKRDVMLTESRMSELFAVPKETLRGFRKNRRGPQGPPVVETSAGPRYPLTTAHRWFRERWMPYRLRQKIEAVEAEEAEALGAVRVGS